ncbi:MAG: sugar transferase [Bacteroidota bacterium]|nr:sugar transferase [Flavisolibacter sp.]MBD0298631.1 sugar transferase [Flavisolibacter sp.]MBD0353341.1 sugar transferase [Flavisolibacter sp.]MBD0366301.1 sugar transferase [Flavisolibacter sp.]MDQ3842702.1 sugar transferase [Bacteroidota bacterium]
MYVHLFKPLFDFFVALTIFLLLLPLFLILTLVLSIVNGGKAFFLQERGGMHERIFKVIKFKTMSDKRDAHGNLLPDADRLTVFGKFVRRTSLDEIPQLINVLKGDMSLVGPRPFISDYLPLYSAVQRQRFLVRPGITGWAQINGRNAITWTKKLEYDVWYANNISLTLDIRIMIKTISKVFKTSDVNQSTMVTAERFNGYN